MDNRLEQLIQAEIDGVNTPEQSAELQAMLKENDKARKFYNDLKKLSDGLHSLRNVNPPPGMAQSIKAKISEGSTATVHELQSETSNETIMSESKTSTMRMAASIALIIAVVLALFYFAGNMSQPDETSVIGTMSDTDSPDTTATQGIERAQRVRHVQVQNLDIVLDNPRFQNLLQSDRFVHLLETGKLQELASNETFQSLMNSDSFQTLMNDPNFQQLQNNQDQFDVFWAAFNDPQYITLFNDESFQQLMLDHSTVFELQAATDGGDNVMNNAEFQNLMNDPAFVDLMNDPGFINLMNNQELVALMNDPSFTSIMNDPAFIDLMNDETFVVMMNDITFMSLMNDANFQTLMNDPSFIDLMNDSDFHMCCTDLP